MSKRRKRGQNSPSEVIPFADWLPPESGPSKYYAQLVFANSEGGSGPLCIVGRELRLVWYETRKDRDKERNGKLVCVLEFQECWRTPFPSGDRYHFAALLLEDVSGDYRQWLCHQEHAGRPFREDTDVLETQVEFSVAAEPADREPFLGPAPTAQPFSIQHPEIESLSSPQLDMLFDVMSFLYQNIPAMQLMEDLRRQKLESGEPGPAELAPSNPVGRPLASS